MAAAVGFDANSDGVMDVADGAWLLARNFRAGGDPPCLAAVEAYDKVDDSGTAYAIWYALISGTAVPPVAPGACAAPADAPAACGDGLSMAIAAPERVTAATFEADVTLTSPHLAVEAWSLSVAAEGCAVTAATLAGTLGADRRDAPPGRRDGGLGMAQVSQSGGAVSMVVLDPVGGATVTPAGESVLHLTVEAPVGATCGACTLTLRDGEAGRGRALTNAASAGGRSYAPVTAAATIEVCPG